MSAYNKLKVDPNRVEEGVWVDVVVDTETEETWSFRIGHSSSSNKRLLKAREASARRNKATNLGKPSTIELIENSKEVFVDGILYEWKNVSGPDGNPMSFTRDNAIRLFTDIPQILDALTQKSLDSSLFSGGTVEADSGNSGPASDTN